MSDRDREGADAQCLAPGSLTLLVGRVTLARTGNSRENAHACEDQHSHSDPARREVHHVGPEGQPKDDHTVTG
jgi:hypothetical protein